MHPSFDTLLLNYLKSLQHEHLFCPVNMYTLLLQVPRLIKAEDTVLFSDNQQVAHIYEITKSGSIQKMCSVTY